VITPATELRPKYAAAVLSRIAEFLASSCGLKISYRVRERNKKNYYYIGV